MFDYYRFRFKMLDGWHPEPGYELAVPIGFLGIALIVFLSIHYDVPLSIFIARASVPQPVGAAFGLVGLLVFASYAADDFKRIGLWAVVAICLVGLCGTIFYTDYLLAMDGVRGYVEESDIPPSAYVTGAAFVVYLLSALGLTASRFRGPYGH